MKRTTQNRASLLRLGLVATSVAAVGLTACDQQNLFTGPGLGGGAGGEPTVTITGTRATAPLGDSLQVTVRVRDDRALTSVSLVGRTLRGDVDLGTDVSVERFTERVVTLTDAPRDTLISRYPDF